MTSDLGLVGLGVMGSNLACNFADHGATVSVYNRTASVTEDFVAGDGNRPDIVATYDLAELVESLGRPRRILLMVAAGRPVDYVLADLLPHLEPGDVVIDGGNSLFTDTERRVAEMAEHGVHFVGCGVSGGEEGARHGPSLMPGGAEEAWPLIRDLFQAVAARAPDGTPCCEWLGPGGSGHYVKMVHNGIEYGDMQVIAEAYHLMKAGLGLGHDAMSAIFRDWNRGVLDSFLIEITADILALAVDGERRLEAILDAAGQKGTGKWTVISSLELGQPMTLVAEAVYARVVSALKEERLRAAKLLDGPDGSIDADPDRFVAAIEKALYASKIVSYAQGFMQLRAASDEYRWDLDLGRVARLWRAGCIIRARFLDDISAAFDRNPHNLMEDDFFRSALASAQEPWRTVVGEAVRAGIPVPAYASALAFYDSFRSPYLPANLIQAQRDYFGAHTYERVDRPRGEFFHTRWTEDGRELSSD